VFNGRRFESDGVPRQERSSNQPCDGQERPHLFSFAKYDGGTLTQRASIASGIFRFDAQEAATAYIINALDKHSAELIQFLARR
jgi:hypothetical protein